MTRVGDDSVIGFTGNDTIDGGKGGRRLALLVLACAVIAVVGLVSPAAAASRTFSAGTITINDLPASSFDGAPITINNDVGQHSFSNTASIAIPATGSRGQAAPYPSEINVSGLTGVVTDVYLTLRGFNHTWPDDVDVVLQGPGGASAVVMSDAGGDFDANADLSFYDRAASDLPDHAQLVSGSFKPTNHERFDAFPIPVPIERGSALSAFDGTDPNGAWKLYVVDDLAGEWGSIAGGWSLIIYTQHTPATPYPSEINVSGLTGTVADVNLALNDLSHARPNDVDVMLVGPTGAKAMVMSDAGGNGYTTPANNVDLVLDDEAANPLPDQAQLVNGSFRPANYSDLFGSDVFPAPAPDPAGSGSALSAFDGTDPNGVWKLYVVDGWNGLAGSVAGGWSLTISTNDPPPPGCTIVGTEGDDAIPASQSPGNDTICGLGGNDTIDAGAGDDTVKGGGGDDTLTGGTGSDDLFGQAGNDTLNTRDGVKGNDTANGGPGTDACTTNKRDGKVSCP